MSTTRIIGIALLVGGLIALFFGFQASESLGEQLHEGFTGRFTESTMGYFIVGGVASVVGLAMLLKR